MVNKRTKTIMTVNEMIQRGATPAEVIEPLFEAVGRTDAQKVMDRCARGEHGKGLTDYIVKELETMTDEQCDDFLTKVEGWKPEADNAGNVR